ncbi:MAG: hypothetical protein ABR500_14815 [Dermatophilaceae bacterium]
MGTGIVFVVLVAIWVAYFVQYWSRRREHLATARSVESFAEAMRVLERRPALRAPSGHRISSAYAMSPARVVSARPAPRPQVIAKPHPTTPSPLRGGALRMSTPAAPTPAPQDSTPPQRLTRNARAAGPRPKRSRPRPATSPVTSSPSRKVRGLALLGSFVVTLVIAALAAFSLLLWWVPLIGVAVVGASFLWLRSSVQAEIAARRGSRGRKPARRSVQRPARRSAQGPSAPAAAERTGAPAQEHAAISSSVDAAEPELIEAIIAAEDSVSAADEQRTDAWKPVPVPPPTYTLKAKAERPAVPAPAVTGEDPSASVVTQAQDADRTAAYGT